MFVRERVEEEDEPMIHRRTGSLAAVLSLLVFAAFSVEVILAGMCDPRLERVAAKPAFERALGEPASRAACPHTLAAGAVGKPAGESTHSEHDQDAEPPTCPFVFAGLGSCVTLLLPAASVAEQPASIAKDHALPLPKHTPDLLLIHDLFHPPRT